MSKIQYQQKPSTSNPSTEQPSNGNSSNPERKQYQDRPYNNNRSYNNDQNGNYNRKPKYQNKERNFRSRFGFDYDESKIGYNTEIPEMPEKPKTKPDDAKYNKKVDDLKQKETELRAARKQKKDTYKNGSKSFTDEIQKQKQNIELAKACLVILNYDKDVFEKEIDELENKIVSHKKKIDFLSKPVQRGGRNLDIQKMSYADLVREEERILGEMSVKNLTKAQEVEYSNLLNKLKKRKIEVPKESDKVNLSDDKSDEVASHRNTVEKLKNIKANLTDRISDIDSKIESIEDDIADFESKIEDTHNKMKYTDNSKLLEQAAELKKQIYAIWDELKELEDQHKAKIHDYEYEQEKIKYIQWAKQVKAKKAEEWQLEKQERKRQRLKEKEFNKKKGDTKDQKTTKEGETKPGETTEDKPQYERKVFNKNQKEIDSCAFLVQYCKDLQQTGSKTEQKQVETSVKLEDALKKGEWAKMKNVEVIKSKKAKDADEQVEQKTYKKRENKNVVPETTDRFSHTYFVAQVFDSVKVLPPAKPEELEKVINELEDKMEYYLAHPEEGVEKSLLSKKDDERETKGRGTRRIINTEEFPSLR